MIKIHPFVLNMELFFPGGVVGPLFHGELEESNYHGSWWGTRRWFWYQRTRSLPSSVLMKFLMKVTADVPSGLP